MLSLVWGDPRSALVSFGPDSREAQPAALGAQSEGTQRKQGGRPLRLFWVVFRTCLCDPSLTSPPRGFRLFQGPQRARFWKVKALK